MAFFFARSLQVFEETGGIWPVDQIDQTIQMYFSTKMPNLKVGWFLFAYGIFACCFLAVAVY